MTTSTSRWIAIVVLLVLAVLTGVVQMPDVAWRLQVIAFKSQGKIPDLAWVELLRMLTPGSGYYVRGLVDNPNPFEVIHNPYDSPEDRRQGTELFRVRCGGCHGLDGRGGNAPDLVQRQLATGDSSWALFRTTQRGVAGTAMGPIALDDRDRWRIVGHVAAMREQIDHSSTGSASEVTVSISIGAEELERVGGPSQDWLTYSGGYNGWRFSALDQLTDENIGGLELAWVIQLDAREMVESSPLVADGILFVTEPPSNVHAVDAATGRTIWSYHRNVPEDVAACCGRVNRGVAIFGDRVYVGTLDAHLVALSARTGSVIWDVEVAPYQENYSITGAPLAVRGKVVVGVGGGDYGIRGFIDAYDATTGARIWRFATIPQPGEFGADTWSGDSWKSGGAATWMTGAFDPERRQVYWGVGNPAADFDGSNRLGDNLFTDSVVSLDLDSGVRSWHFQFTPHDEHDWDSNQVPVLIDHDVGGNMRPLMLWANKNGFYYVLDRSNGRLVTAKAFAKQNWAKEIDENGRPILSESVAPTEKGTLTWPGASGATNWWAPSYSPLVDLFFVPILERPGVFFRGPGGDVPQKGVPMLGGGVNHTLTKQTGVIALSPTTGERIWRYEMPIRVGAHERWQIGGILTTAGNLLFIGDSEVFYALRASTGEKLWSVNLGGHINASPITFMADGHQLVVIAAGNSLFAFRTTSVQ